MTPPESAESWARGLVNGFWGMVEKVPRGERLVTYLAAAITADRAARPPRDRLEKAEALLRVAIDGGMTDYTEVENVPVCGICGYEVECCQRKGWDDDGMPYTEDNPCPGIEARAFLAGTDVTRQPVGIASGCGRAWNSRDGLAGYILRNSNAWCSIACADARKHLENDPKQGDER